MVDKNNGGKKVMNILSGPEQFKLCQSILKNHEAVIKAKNMTQEEAAEWYSEALGFKVTKPNLSNAYTAVEVPWKPQRGKHGQQGAKSKADECLAKAIIHLFSAFSMPVPPEIEAIAKRQRIKDCDE